MACRTRGKGAQSRADRSRPRHHEGQPERQALWPARSEDRRIIEAYGFDLSPIAARHAEFVRLAEEAKAERAEMGRLRRRATIARNGITQILETAAEYGFEGEEWVNLVRDSRNLTQALRKIERPEEMALGVESLERRQRAGAGTPGKSACGARAGRCRSSEFGPQGARKRTPPIYLQTKSLS